MYTCNIHGNAVQSIAQGLSTPAPESGDPGGSFPLCALVSVLPPSLT